jgi:hypothetical protein
MKPRAKIIREFATTMGSVVGIDGAGFAPDAVSLVIEALINADGGLVLPNLGRRAPSVQQKPSVEQKTGNAA